ncbi:MAG: hypothetical protein J0H30_12390 [Alphaproteobacteria bacterium]|nr:hypothetical protein [Alphaproteobacteria bacterium]
MGLDDAEIPGIEAGVVIGHRLQLRLAFSLENATRLLSFFELEDAAGLFGLFKLEDATGFLGFFKLEDTAGLLSLFEFEDATGLLSFFELEDTAGFRLLGCFNHREGLDRASLENTTRFVLYGIHYVNSLGGSGNPAGVPMYQNEPGIGIVWLPHLRRINNSFTILSVV